MAEVSDAKLLFQPSNLAVAKGVGALTLAALCFYFLTTGRNQNDPNRLFWSAICAVAIPVLFLI